VQVTWNFALNATMKKMASFKAECQSLNGIPVSTEQTHLWKMSNFKIWHIWQRKMPLSNPVYSMVFLITNSLYGQMRKLLCLLFCWRSVNIKFIVTNCRKFCRGSNIICPYTYRFFFSLLDLYTLILWITVSYAGLFHTAHTSGIANVNPFYWGY